MKGDQDSGGADIEILEIVGLEETAEDDAVEPDAGEGQVEILEIVGLEETAEDDAVEPDAGEGQVEILEIVGLQEAPEDGDLEPQQVEERVDMVAERARARRVGHLDGVRGVLREMLPALDDLESCIREMPDARALEEGVRLALRGLWNVFRQHDLERIEGEGMAFDPRLHEAGIVTPTDRVEPNTVLETLRVGYSVGGVLVRPALVRVSGEASGRGRESNQGALDPLENERGSTK